MCDITLETPKLSCSEANTLLRKAVEQNRIDIVKWLVKHYTGPGLKQTKALLNIKRGLRRPKDLLKMVVKLNRLEIALILYPGHKASAIEYEAICQSNLHMYTSVRSYLCQNDIPTYQGDVTCIKCFNDDTPEMVKIILEDGYYDACYNNGEWITHAPLAVKFLIINYFNKKLERDITMIKEVGGCYAEEDIKSHINTYSIMIRNITSTF